MKIRDGYIIIFRPGHPVAESAGWAAEHRVVAYDAGLLTDLSLHVHHIDGDKTNNVPENLLVLTHSEHARLHARGQSLKTHCKHGHPYDEANTRVLPDGRRRCRACERASSARYQARRKESSDA